MAMEAAPLRLMTISNKSRYKWTMSVQTQNPVELNDSLLFLTNLNLSDQYDHVVPLIPITCSSLCNRMLWLITSNAAPRSKRPNIDIRVILTDFLPFSFSSWRGVCDWWRQQRLSEGYSQWDAESGIQLLLLPLRLLLGLAVCHDDPH